MDVLLAVAAATCPPTSLPAGLPAWVVSVICDAINKSCFIVFKGHLDLCLFGCRFVLFHSLDGVIDYHLLLVVAVDCNNIYSNIL